MTEIGDTLDEEHFGGGILDFLFFSQIYNSVLLLSLPPFCFFFFFFAFEGFFNSNFD